MPEVSWPQTQHGRKPFWITRSRFPWTNNNNQGSSPAKAKDRQTPRKNQIPKIGESTSKIHWIPELLSKLYTWIGRTTHSVLSTAQNYGRQAKIPITPDIMKEFEEKNEALDRCCQLALRVPLPGKQLVLMADASFQAAGYAVLIEDDPNQKYTSTRKTYGPIAHGSKTYSPSQIKMSIYAKEFLAIYMAFKEFGHIFWGAIKPVIILTNSNLVTRFFQTKMNPPALWNACDFLLQFNFTVAHIPGRMNTAGVFIPFINGSQ